MTLRLRWSSLCPNKAIGEWVHVWKKSDDLIFRFLRTIRTIITTRTSAGSSWWTVATRYTKTYQTDYRCSSRSSLRRRILFRNWLGFTKTRKKYAAERSVNWFVHLLQSANEICFGNQNLQLACERFGWNIVWQRLWRLWTVKRKIGSMFMSHRLRNPRSNQTCPDRLLRSRTSKLISSRTTARCAVFQSLVLRRAWWSVDRQQGAENGRVWQGVGLRDWRIFSF